MKMNCCYRYFNKVFKNFFLALVSPILLPVPRFPLGNHGSPPLSLCLGLSLARGMGVWAGLANVSIASLQPQGVAQEWYVIQTEGHQVQMQDLEHSSQGRGISFPPGRRRGCDLAWNSRSHAASTVGTACLRMGPAQRQTEVGGDGGREGEGEGRGRRRGGGGRESPMSLDLPEPVFGSTWTFLLCFLF